MRKLPFDKAKLEEIASRWPTPFHIYAAFWRRYKRPPRKDYWNFIVNRLDLLVPQDVRERKGSFFTPKTTLAMADIYQRFV